MAVYRDRVCIDGGFTLFMPPTAAEETVNYLIICCVLEDLKRVIFCVEFELARVELL